MQLYFVHEMNGDRAIGDETESRHLSKVMRNHVGDLAFVTNGNGVIWEAEILSLGRSSVTFKTLRIARKDAEMNKTAIAVAPTKSSSRIEDLVEKGVELGLTDIYLIKTERTLRKDFKTKRLQRLVISALKQSHRTFLPRVHELQSFEDFLKQSKEMYKNQYIGKIEGNNQFLVNEDVSDDTIVLIGPEGDFTDSEYDLAAKAGYKAVLLSEQRLRTETAGIMAIAAIQNKRNLND